MSKEVQIGLGGGCHWCTEAVFQQLKGVSKVEQGWIASMDEHEDYSEAILVHYYPTLIATTTLVEIHLLTHASTSSHSMRKKYRSAIYCVDSQEKSKLENLLEEKRKSNKLDYVTQVLVLKSFRLNEEKFLNYYQKRPDAPFCQTYISPKLTLLRKQFSEHIN